MEIIENPNLDSYTFDIPKEIAKTRRKVDKWIKIQNSLASNILKKPVLTQINMKSGRPSTIILRPILLIDKETYEANPDKYFSLGNLPSNETYEVPITFQ